MGDALGTYFEARACVAVDAPSLKNGGITRSAIALCELCYKTLKEMGITDPSRIMIAAEKACVPGETIHNMPGDVTPEQLYHAMLAADLLGQEYFK